MTDLLENCPTLADSNMSNSTNDLFGANQLSDDSGTENMEPKDSIEPNTSQSENEPSCSIQINYGNSLQDRLFALLENKIGTDVTFVVGEQDNTVEVEAHKNILASASPVFFSMFFGSFDSEDIVTVTDCDTASFQRTIQWIYNGKLEKMVSSIKWAELLHVARKYQIQLLENECSTQLQSLIVPSTALMILTLGSLYDLPLLEDIAWHFVLRNTSKVLAHYSQHLNRSTLLLILTQENINISEVHLFLHTVAWAKRECSTGSLEETPENIRIVLEGLLYFIRFPTMSPEEIANFVVPTQILSMTEIGGIYCRKFTSPTPFNPSYEFNSQPRGRLPPICNSIFKKDKHNVNCVLNERKTRRRLNCSNTPTECVEENGETVSRSASNRRSRRRRTREQNANNEMED